MPPRDALDVAAPAGLSEPRDTAALLWPRGESLVALLYVVHMMDRVVDEVTRERIDGETHSVAARPRAVPLVAGYRVEPIRERGAGILDLIRDTSGISTDVVVIDGCLILIPVRK